VSGTRIWVTSAAEVVTFIHGGKATPALFEEKCGVTGQVKKKKKSEDKGRGVLAIQSGTERLSSPRRPRTIQKGESSVERGGSTGGWTGEEGQSPKIRESDEGRHYPKVEGEGETRGGAGRCRVWGGGSPKDGVGGEKRTSSLWGSSGTGGTLRCVGLITSTI